MRAVESVFAQTWSDWELIVADDEDPPGSSWDWLQALAASRDNVRVMRNPGPHGQCGNMNLLLRQARGQWIKPLYDDDVLKPRCLELFAQAVRGRGAVAMVSCRSAHFRNGGCIREEPSDRPRLELVSQRFVHLGMYLQDDVGGGIPTQVMVKREAIERGALFDDSTGVRHAVDSLWFMEVARHGDSLLINLPLIEQHQGGHETLTSTIAQAELDREYKLLRPLQLRLVDPSLNPPPLQTVDSMLDLIRALNRLTRGRVPEALKLAMRASRPRAWLLAMRWLLRRRFPRRFHEVPRQTLDFSAS